jgi:hypothetical protein
VEPPPRAVRREGLAAVTTTASAISAIGSETSRRAIAPTDTRTVVVTVWKPMSSKVRVYSPGARPGN